YAGRTGHELHVIGVVPIGEKIAVGRGIKNILVRFGTDGSGDVVGEIAIGAEVAVFIFELEFAAFAIAPRPVELRQHHSLTELTIIEHIPGVLVIGVDPDIEARKHRLVHADVVIVGTLGFHRIGQRHLRLIGGVGEQSEVGLGGLGLVGRREIAGIAGVNAGACKRLIDQRDARTELVGVDVLIQLVEPQTGVQRKLIRYFPVVLNVGSNVPSGLRIVIGD